MSSLNLNKVVLCGRLTADPELKQTGSGIAVVTFTLAVNRRFQSRQAGEAAPAQQADFISVVAWRQTAEFISKYFKKGSMAVIDGRLQTRSWEGTDGKKGFATEVIVNNIYFGESKKEEAEKPIITPDNILSADDGDLPF